MTEQDWQRAIARFNEELGARVRARQDRRRQTNRYWLAMAATLAALALLLTMWVVG